jgi:hypothetical protein
MKSQETDPENEQGANDGRTGKEIEASCIRGESLFGPGLDVRRDETPDRTH